MMRSCHSAIDNPRFHPPKMWVSRVIIAISEMVLIIRRTARIIQAQIDQNFIAFRRF